MLSESAARWLLVLHTALGVAAVGAATHLVIWLRRALRGETGRMRAVRRFAVWSLVLHAAAFTDGSVMYPTYKVEVRTAYLENASAIATAATAHAGEVARVTGEPSNPATAELVHRAAQAARWFDVKENWVALGLVVSLALVLILAWWDPARDGTALGPLLLGFAVIVAGTLWLAAIIGVVTVSWRAV